MASPHKGNKYVNKYLGNIFSHIYMLVGIAFSTPLLYLHIYSRLSHTPWYMPKAMGYYRVCVRATADDLVEI